MAQAGRFAGVRSLLTVDVAAIGGVTDVVLGPADAVVLDAGADAVAGGAVAARLRATRDRPPLLLVRIASVETGPPDAGLDVAMAWRPDAILLSAARDGAAIQHLGVKLAVREAALGLPEGATAIVAECAAAGLLSLGGLAGASPRLAAVTWDAGRLTGECGGQSGAFDDDPARAVTRTLVILAAAAAGVPAFDSAILAGPAAFDRDCRAARRLGYAGKVAADGAQAARINAVFSRASDGRPDNPSDDPATMPPPSSRGA